MAFFLVYAKHILGSFGRNANGNLHFSLTAKYTDHTTVMSTKQSDHQALYRKYRPNAWDEVLGQDHVVKALTGAIAQGKIAHAYLFAGSRGTGKTSIARIFARVIGTSDTDLNEIDAASNRGIDDVRALRESVQTLPFESPYKVYIIDEVHMLTKEAFNALLKTLEEPPHFVIFILATTELNKVPETIVSRCQTFTFKKPTQTILKELVLDVARREGYKIDPASAELVALLGDGSFRDTHGVLQKVLSSTEGKTVTPDEVERITGAPKTVLVNDLLVGAATGDTERALQAIRTARDENVDMKTFAKLLLRKMRAALLMRFDAGYASRMAEEFTEEDAGFLKKLAGDKTARLTSDTVIAFLDAHDRIGSSAIPELPLELAVIQLVEKK